MVVSDFVNPLQFSPEEDLKVYPRDIQHDNIEASKAGADILFVPEQEELYPTSFNSSVQVFSMTNVLEGATRPTHFQGVTTIVTKLLNIVEPQTIYFGQKDAQQLIIVKKLIRDLNFSVQVISCPIIREKDGLAKSSRNIFLSQQERQAAVSLYQSLTLANKALINGQTDVKKLVETIINRIKQEKLVAIDYVKVVDQQTLEQLETIEDSALILIAAKVGRTRLIDNLIYHKSL